jgi:hypothetical protein
MLDRFRFFSTGASSIKLFLFGFDKLERFALTDKNFGAYLTKVEHLYRHYLLVREKTFTSVKYN